MDHRVSKDMISSGMTPSGEKTQSDLGKTQYGSAPSPNRLMDAYHSMYQDQKEETVDEGMVGDAVKKVKDMGTKVVKDVKFQASNMTDKAGKDQRRAIARKALEDANTKNVNDSVDLLAAYRAVYEHHKKDEDGNTIPHEDDVKEGKIPAGLQAYLDKKKGKKKDDDGDEKKDKKDVKDSYDLVYNHFINEGFSEEETYERMSNLTEQQLDEFLSAVAKFGTGLFKGGKTLAKTTFNKTKNLANKAMNKVQNIAKPSGNSPKITSSGGKIEQGGNDKPRNNLLSTDNLVKAQVVGSMLSGSGQQKQRSGTVSASADLFDIVKGQLLDEGLSEEEIRDIMLELTPEEILNEITGNLAMKASRAADMKRAQLAKAGDRAGAADKAAQASRLYKKGAERNLAKQDLSKPLNPQPTNYPKGKGASYQEKPGM